MNEQTLSFTAMMLAPVLIALIFFRYRRLQVEARYRALVQIAEKGVELPALLLADPQANFSERRRGLVLVAAGLGIMAMVVALPFRLDDGRSIASLWGIGLLPLMTGLGYLASWWFSRIDTRR
ncbi:DUF6249 domain-containing protein [Sphingomonas azotifigens]|uniref:DUF6249 domain-containing protein n=1 Tax=Sphingomonas azotifigens TaxID=330920 RepID=UPI000A000BC4|nr:DUF6249 domain-containing protein [Sphingomonas azotifigens]